MRSVTIIVMLEFEQLSLQVHSRPKQHPVQVLPPDRADQAFDERMRERHTRNCFDFCDLQYPQIGLPLVEPIQRIVIRAEILRQAVTTNRSIKHSTQHRSVYDSAVNTKPNDLPRELVPHDQNPMRCQRCRFTSEQITAPQAVLRMAEEGQPGWAGIRFRPMVSAQDAANHVFIDLDAKRHVDSLGDPRAAPPWIPLFHFNDSGDEFLARSLWPRSTPNLGREQQTVLSPSQKIMKMQERGWS